MDVLTEAAKQVPSLAVLVMVVVYFLKYLERSTQIMYDRVKDLGMVNKEGMKGFEAALEHLTTEVSSNKEVTAKLTQILIWHDATVRGINPEAVGSTEEILRKILNK